MPLCMPVKVYVSVPDALLGMGSDPVVKLPPSSACAVAITPSLLFTCTGSSWPKFLPPRSIEVPARIFCGGVSRLGEPLGNQGPLLVVIPPVFGGSGVVMPACSSNVSILWRSVFISDWICAMSASRLLVLLVSMVLVTIEVPVMVMDSVAVLLLPPPLFTRKVNESDPIKFMFGV